MNFSDISPTAFCYGQECLSAAYWSSMQFPVQFLWCCEICDLNVDSVVPTNCLKNGQMHSSHSWLTIITNFQYLTLLTLHTSNITQFQKLSNSLQAVTLHATCFKTVTFCWLYLPQSLKWNKADTEDLINQLPPPVVLLYYFSLLIFKLNCRLYSCRAKAHYISYELHEAVDDIIAGCWRVCIDIIALLYERYSLLTGPHIGAVISEVPLDVLRDMPWTVHVLREVENGTNGIDKSPQISIFLYTNVVTKHYPDLTSCLLRLSPLTV